jgi:hypothetical protein
MKKLVIIVFGLLLIVGGFIVFILTGNNKNNDKNNIDDDSYINISQFKSDLSFDDKIYYDEQIEYRELCTNDYDFNKKDSYCINIPSFVKDSKEETYYEKVLTNEIFDISLVNNKQTFDFDNYVKSNIDDNNFLINKRSYERRVSGYDVKYLILDYYHKEDKFNKEKLIIYASNNNNNILYEYSLSGYLLEDKELESIINSFRIDEGKANYNNSTRENGRLIVNLKSESDILQKNNKGVNEYSWGDTKNSYSLQYVVDESSIKILDSEEMDKSIANFSSINDDYKLNLSMMAVRYDFADFMKIVISKDANIIENNSITINEKEYYKIVYSYDKSTYVIYGVDEENGIKVEFVFEFDKDSNINYSSIEKLLNYKISKDN